MDKEDKRIVLGILAHVDAGKTTLSEAILYKTGEIRQLGRVDHGNTLLDDDAIERNRGITIFSRQARFTAGGTEVTLIDTPGHVDFAAEMERSLSVIDYALLVVSGSEGVQAHTRTLYRMLSQKGIPVLVFINKMDIAVRPREELLSELAAELGAGIVDFSHVLGNAAADYPESFLDDVTLYSPELAEMVLEDREPEDADIAEAVRRQEIVPCVFGSALKNEGIEGLLDLIDRFTLMPEYGDEFAAKVYKVAKSEDGERICFIRITGGELHVRDKIAGRTSQSSGINANQSVQTGSRSACRPVRDFDWEDKVNQIRFYSGSKYVTADSAPAGTVPAVTGLASALPGDGIGAEAPAAGQMIRPVMIYTVSGPDGKDPYLVMQDLRLLQAEDPMLGLRWREDTGTIEIRLMGQVQLEVLQAMIRDRFGYDVTFDSGSVLYLETISGTYEGVGHFEPLRHYAETHLIIEPGERGSGIVITTETPEDELSRNWQRLILTHLEEKEHAGVLTGAPLTDVRISLAAGRAHDKHTNGGDFREATYRAVRNALMQARRDGRAELLEPWMEYEIELPAVHVGRAMTDIRQMGGTQDDLEQTADTARIRGRVPASEITGYQQTLTGYTSGAGKLACTPAGYDICHNADAVIEASGYDPERDIDNPADSVFVNHSGSDIVPWDEVPQHMHLASVLSRRMDNSRDPYASPFASGAGSMRENRRSFSPSDPADVKEEARRRQAAEKELRSIFERTYGPVKDRHHIQKNEYDYSKPRLTAEEQAANEARNKEIRARHERKVEPAETEPPMLLIDGYNLIYANQYLKELSARDMGSARDQLLERLSNYAGYLGWEVIVVFDAYNVRGGEGYEERYNGLRIFYTAEDEPADIRMGIITGTVHGRTVYVVSSDSLVQQDAWGHGALRISSREFMEMLSRTEDEIRSKL